MQLLSTQLRTEFLEALQTHVLGSVETQLTRAGHAGCALRIKRGATNLKHALRALKKAGWRHHQRSSGVQILARADGSWPLHVEGNVLWVETDHLHFPAPYEELRTHFREYVNSAQARVWMSPDPSLYSRAEEARARVRAAGCLHAPHAVVTQGVFHTSLTLRPTLRTTI